MKKSILSLSLSLILFSCKNDEQDPSKTPVLIDEEQVQPSEKGACEVRKWKNNVVYWQLIDPYPNFDVASQRASIKKAFDTWATYIPLTFVEVTKEADIEIRFVCGTWMDRDLSGKIYEKSFEHGSKTIGFGFYPPSICKSNQTEKFLAEGNIYFSSCLSYDEMGDSKAYPFQVLAVHELGHALGLGHNSNINSVMNEAATTSVLSAEDIRNIQAIYGYTPSLVPTPTPVTPVPVPTPTPVPTQQSQMYITPSVGSKSSDYYSDKDDNSCGLLFFNGVNFEVLSLSGNTIKIRVNKYSTGSFQKGGQFYIKTGGMCGTALYTHTYQAGGSFDYTFTIYKGQNLTMTITSDTGDRFNLGGITAD